jgi:hypothetical protein
VVSFAVNASQLATTDSHGSTVLYGGSHELVASRGHGASLTAAVKVEAPPSGLLVDTLM